MGRTLSILLLSIPMINVLSQSENELPTRLRVTVKRIQGQRIRFEKAMQLTSAIAKATKAPRDIDILHNNTQSVLA
ncbi:hypothetical protein BV22DRAFT_504326 [Leucogyrophana mollusca]|uniref:Uncharacterized protein n=1 Tax=Leucogyrophana mollusca TaxID=85980 RepID=A0ACB8BGB0_9AGAM|nr:hypothetical protein BV22DRAFT_504326 [Leucogyrophana mollusca]